MALEPCDGIPQRPIVADKQPPEVWTSTFFHRFLRVDGDTIIKLCMEGPTLACRIHYVDHLGGRGDPSAQCVVERRQGDFAKSSSLPTAQIIGNLGRRKAYWTLPV